MMKYLTAVLLGMLALAGANATTIKVAFVISEGANVMDIAGPWEVFQDTMLDDDKETMPFELYTVAPSKAPLHTTGSGRPGMTVTPDYSFADAPAPISWWWARNQAAPSCKRGSNASMPTARRCCQSAPALSSWRGQGY